MAKPGNWECNTFAELKVGCKLFKDRGYTLSENCAPLAGVKFICVKLDGEKTLKCKQGGMLYLLTPQPDRNTDSVSKELTDQGFQKVALPEVRLFDRANTRNYCTLYQKNCKAGEKVTFGKWGVPLFFKK